MTRAQMEVEGRAEQQDPHFALPPSLLRRFEVLVRPRCKATRRKMREISADCIGSLVSFKGIVTQVWMWRRRWWCVIGQGAHPHPVLVRAVRGLLGNVLHRARLLRVGTPLSLAAYATLACLRYTLRRAFTRRCLTCARC